MKIVSYKNGEGVDEVIIGLKGFSRLDSKTIDEASLLARQYKATNKRVLFEWDVLAVESEFAKLQTKFKEIPHQLFDAFRVRDIGAIHYLTKNYPELSLQLLLDNGNHNLKGLLEWERVTSAKVERLILSSQIPKARLCEYLKELKTPVELLGLGRIDLFYTPRKLLASYVGSYENSIEIKGSSEESPHKGFPIIENESGTHMQHIRDCNLLPHLDELKEMGVTHLRLDVRPYLDLEVGADLQKLSDDYPERSFCGFYKVNKTEVIFEKLKNQDRLRDDEGYIGDVIDVNKPHQVGILIRSNKEQLAPGDRIIIKTPEGKTIERNITSIKNSENFELESSKGQTLIFVPHIKSVSVRSLVYLKNS